MARRGFFHVPATLPEFQERSSDMRFIPLSKIEDKAGVKKTKIYAMIANREFPQPRKVGRRSLWLESEIDEWIAQIAASNTPEPTNKKKKG
ncbi:MAG: helix-turn-helix transcriptional regulator [Phycisphaerae bacterium]